MTNNGMIKLDEVAEKVLEGNCMLFLGSGFSAGAINILDEELPIGGGLSKLLDKETGEDNDGDLEESAERYIEQFGEPALAQKLRDSFTVKTLADGQKTISNCKWRRIYTTNYDNSVEWAVSKEGGRFLPITLSADAQEFVNKRDIVVHLNGSIYNLSSNTLSSEFKLTSGSYLTQQFENSTWRNIFEYDIRDSDLIVFVGFSLRYDLEIKKLLWEDEYTKNKCVFIMNEGENERNVRKASRYGTVFPIGRSEFALAIEKVWCNTPQHVTKLERPLLCFRTPSVRKESVAKIPDGSITNLFLFGKIDDLLIQRSIEYPDSLPYYIHRKEIETAIKYIVNGARDVLIHSDLGNGKTLFMRGLVYGLLKEGYKVYEYNKYYASLHDEIERICSTGDARTVIVIENYNANRRIVESVQTFRNKQRLIVSERSVTNDMSYDWLRDKVGRYFYEIDINRLDDEEIKQLITILDQFGLWRKYSALRFDYKLDFLRTDCKRSLRLVLLEVINSLDIRKRIETDIRRISNEPIIYEALVLIFVSNLLDWNMNLDDISYALGDTIKGNPLFRRNDVVKEFVNFDYSEIKVKSSILSEIILTHIMDVNVVRSTLVKAFHNFDKNLTEPEYRRYMMTIVSFANLQRVFNKEDGDDVFNSNIVILFEDIRNSRFCTNNPHYWLQYAIAKLVEPKYEEAKLYFDNAYAFAKRKANFDTYQIDNHYARYLLVNVIDTENVEEYFEAFKQAHTILTDRNHQKDTKFYPFKVARSYLPFYEKFKNKMSQKEKAYFRQACLQIDTMIKAYKAAIPAYRTKLEVRQAEENIGKIMAEFK